MPAIIVWTRHRCVGMAKTAQVPRRTFHGAEPRMCVKVTSVGRASDGSITHLGGSADDGSKRWGLARAEVIQRIESFEWSFFVARPAADPVQVLVREIGGAKRLTTARDDTQTNNLAELPLSEPSLEGIDPQFPLSIPGPRQPVLIEVFGPKAGGGGGTVIAADATGVFRPPGWTTSRPLAQLRLTCNVPFPAHLEVFVERDPSRPDYVEDQHKLAKIEWSQLPSPQVQEGGYYAWDLSIPDATYPRRFTPATIRIGIPKGMQGAAGVTIFVRNVSYNRYCAGPSTPLSIVLARTAYQPPYTYPPTTGRRSPSTSPPAREYKTGAFIEWIPAIRNIGQTTTKGDQRLQVKSATELATTGWPQWGVYTASVSGKRLCQPVGFAVLPGTSGTSGIGFSASGALGVALGILQPNTPGMAGDILFRFVKLGAPGSASMDVPGFVTKPTATVTPRILIDPGEQVALVVDANRSGGTPAARCRLIDLGHGAGSLRDLEFDGSVVSATVVKKSDSSFEAVITTGAGTTKVALPEK